MGEIQMFQNKKRANEVLEPSVNNPTTGWFESTLLKWAGPTVVTGIPGKIKNNMGLTDDTFGECLAEMDKHLTETNNTYLNGTDPGMGDIEAFGVLQCVKKA